MKSGDEATPDLAGAADISVSTVNRVLNQPNSVRQPTRERVMGGAEEIGLYDLGTIRCAVRSALQTHRLGPPLQQRGRRFYRNLCDAMQAEAARRTGKTVDLSPERLARRLVALGEICESVAHIAVQHPIVADAIDAVISKGMPVAGLIAPLSSQANFNFVGLDNWKVGRTAAWAFTKMVREPGKTGILLGNHRNRYRN